MGQKTEPALGREPKARREKRLKAFAGMLGQKGRRKKGGKRHEL